MMKTWRGLAFVLGVLGLGLGPIARSDEEAQHTPANELLVRCLSLVRAETAFPPTANREILEAHQLRMRTLCWDWHALAAPAAQNGDKARNLLARCLAEAPFDLARAHQVYYARNVASMEQMCRDFESLVLQN